MLKICAVIVTKDRYNLLIDCLSSILAEGNEWISNIIVVDNASNDDTAKMGNEIHGKIIVIHLPSNVGVEKGFAVGIQTALKMNVDAILLCDDDSEFLPGSIKSLIDTFLLYGGKAIVNALPLSDPTTGELSSPRVWGRSFIYKKSDLLIAIKGERYIYTDKIHINGCLIGRHILEKCMFTGDLGEEAYGALVFRSGYKLVIDTQANIAHPSSLKRYNVRLISLPLIPVIVWQLPPWKAYQAAREAILKRRILHCFLHFISVDIPIVFGTFLLRIIFEKDRMRKLPFYFRGLFDGLHIALRFRKSKYLLVNQSQFCG